MRLWSTRRKRSFAFLEYGMPYKVHGVSSCKVSLVFVKSWLPNKIAHANHTLLALAFSFLTFLFRCKQKMVTKHFLTSGVCVHRWLTLARRTTHSHWRMPCWGTCRETGRATARETGSSSSGSSSPRAGQAPRVEITSREHFFRMGLWLPDRAPEGMVECVMFYVLCNVRCLQKGVWNEGFL